jgi:hypothetical protein
MKKLVYCLISLGLVACSKTPPEDTWAQKPTTSYTTELDGTKLTWKGPEGMTGLPGGSLSISYGGDIQLPAPPEVIFTKLTAYYPVGDEAIEKDVQSTLLGYKISAHEKLPGGHLYKTHDEKGTVVKIHYFAYGPSFMLKCFASQAYSAGFADVKKAEKLLADACTSVSVEGASLSTTPPAAATQPKAPALVVSEEMKGFVAMLDGKAASVVKALKKYGKKGLNAGNIDMYDLKDATVMRSFSAGASTCYHMEAASGMTTRKYDLCWQDGKLVNVFDRGMKPASF